MVLLLDPYVDAILCLALALLIVGIMESLTPFLQKIPWIGGALADAARSMAQAISHAAGVAVSGIAHAVGTSLHATSRFIDHTYNTIHHIASALEQAASSIASVSGVTHLVRTLAHQIVASLHSVQSAVKKLEKEWRGIEHRVKTLERELANGIGNDVRTRVKALERTVTGIEDQVIPGIRAGIQTAEGELSDLRQWLGVKVGTNYKDWVAGLVLAGLAALGLGGLNCDSNPLKNNKNACGLWGDLSSLLGVVAAILAVENFDALVHEMQQVEQGVISGMHDLFNLP